MNKVQLIREGKEFINSTTNLQDKQITSYQITTNKSTYTLSREQVEIIYRLYPNKNVSGCGLTAANIRSKHFNFYTQSEFNQIINALRAEFGLKKDDGIFAPHEREELTDEERWAKVVQLAKDTQKITDSVNELKNYKELVKEQCSEINELKDFESSVKKIIEEYKPNTTPYIVPNITNKKTLCLWLSDMHIGCRVDDESAIFNQNINYSMDDVRYRLNKVVEQIKYWGPYENLWIFNLGDAIDNINHMTARQDRNQIMPSTMGNHEMMDNYFKVIMDLFDTLAANGVATNYHFRSVGASNHGGEAEWGMSYAIAEVLKLKGVDAKVSNRSINHSLIDNKVVIFMHGKDNWDQKKPFPPTLNPKTEQYLESYIDANGLGGYRGNIYVVKGDSHQKALTANANFEYLSVGSMFGASNWAQANFPARDWEVNMTIFSEYSDPVLFSITDNKKQPITEFC